MLRITLRKVSVGVFFFIFRQKIFKDAYSKDLKEKIKDLQLEQTVYLYDSVQDVQACIYNRKCHTNVNQACLLFCGI
jgi:hypothetical protein